MRESHIETYFVERCRAAGALVRKAQWVGVDGCPDRVVYHQGLTLWVELKRPGIKFPSNAHERQQARRHAEMLTFGVQVHLIDNKEGVDAFVKEFL